MRGQKGTQSANQGIMTGAANMANEHGFKFEIKGEVFVQQKSKAGADVVAAFTEAAEIRTKIQAELLDVPATIAITEPVATSRRVPDPVEADPPEGGEDADGNPNPPAPPSEDGPTPAMDLPSRRRRSSP